MKTKHKKILAQISLTIYFICMALLIVFGGSSALKEISNFYLYGIVLVIIISLSVANGVSFGKMANKINKW